MDAKIAILISGGGSNMQAIHQAILRQDIMAQLTWVASDNANAKGLAYVKASLIPDIILPYQQGKNHAEQYLLALLAQQPIDLLCLAGFMQILSADFINTCQQKYQLPILNIHPSLLPELKGLNTHQRALDAGHQEHGCTVHLVTEQLDDGPILAQSSLDLSSRQGISAQQLQQEVLALEHQLYPMVLKDFAERLMKKQAEPIKAQVEKYAGR